MEVTAFKGEIFHFMALEGFDSDIQSISAIFEDLVITTQFGKVSAKV